MTDPPRVFRTSPSGTQSTAGSRLALPLWILVALGTTFFLREARELFVPVALAVLAAYALYPAVLWIERVGIPRFASAAIVVTLIVAGLAWTGWTLRDDFARGARDLPRQVRALRGQLQSTSAAGVFGRLAEAAREVQATTAVVSGGNEAETGRPPTGASTSPPSAGDLWQGPSSLLWLTGQITVIVFLTYFFIIGAEAWRARLVALASNLLSSRRSGAEVVDEINRQVQRFLLVLLLTGAVVALATWLALLALGAPQPALWGLAAGVFNWIPYFGPIIVSVGLALVGLLSGGMALAIKMSAVALVITTLEGWLLTPLLLGRAARMNTLAILLGLLFWSWVWGVWGTLLAMPLMAMTKAISDHVERLSWLSALLSEDGPKRES